MNTHEKHDGEWVPMNTGMNYPLDGILIKKKGKKNNHNMDGTKEEIMNHRIERHEKHDGEWVPKNIHPKIWENNVANQRKKNNTRDKTQLIEDMKAKKV